MTAPMVTSGRASFASTRWSIPPAFTIMYHAVEADSDDPYGVCISPHAFETQMRRLRRLRLRGVSMCEFVRAHRRGKAGGLVGLTFDDAYRSVLTSALPILQKYDFTATVFAVTEQIGRVNLWDQPGPIRPLLTAEELQYLSNHGIEIGSHSATHSQLGGLPAPSLEREVETSRDDLEQVIGSRVDGFCYPYGSVDAAARAVVAAAGYDYACAIEPGVLLSRFALPRRFMGDRDGPVRFLTKRILHTARTRGIEWTT